MRNTLTNITQLISRPLQHTALGRKLSDESGIGTIEMVLLLVVLIALVILFRDHIKSLLETIMREINSSATSVWGS